MRSSIIFACSTPCPPACRPPSQGVDNPVTDITPTTADINVFPPATGGPWASYNLTVCPYPMPPAPPSGARRLLQIVDPACFLVVCPNDGSEPSQTGPTTCRIPTQPGIPYNVTVSWLSRRPSLASSCRVSG